MRAALAALVLLLAAPAGAAAAPALVAVETFASPVHVNGPDGDAARLFVVEKEGTVQLVVNGQKQATPFLDVTSITDADPANERGLLSIAFAPDYATSGLFYVFLTATAAASPSGVVGDLMVLEGRRSAADPNRAEPGPLRTVFSVPHPSATNHNGGQLAFGPDGLLYASTGDGAVSPANAQDPGSRLGKILRIDPRIAGAAPEVWALGLRNPWRFSFDRLTGDLLIGDVGEGAREEVDFGPAGVGGRNYGWPACEGDVGAGCGTPGFSAPALSLPRDQLYSTVIGGFVVRDPGLPTLAGRYLFADRAQPMLLAAAVGAGGGSGLAPTELTAGTPSSLGEDGCGHVHVARADGSVVRIQDGAPGACVLPVRPIVPPETTPPPPGGGGPAAVDTVKPSIRARAAKRLRRGRLRLTLTADEASTATLRAERFRTRKVTLQAGTPRVVRIAATKRGLRKLRRSLARGRRPEVAIRIAVRDATGNLRVRRVTRKLRR